MFLECSSLILTNSHKHSTFSERKKTVDCMRNSERIFLHINWELWKTFSNESFIFSFISFSHSIPLYYLLINWEWKLMKLVSLFLINSLLFLIGKIKIFRKFFSICVRKFEFKMTGLMSDQIVVIQVFYNFVICFFYSSTFKRN